MTKRLNEQLDKFSAKNKKIRFSFGTLVVMCLSVIAMIVATFTLLKMPNSQGIVLFFNSPTIFIKQKMYMTYGIDYIPQIPILLFICTILGRKFSLMSIIAYILIGIFLFPVFSFGGGIKYFLQYNFGYILAYIPAVLMATFFLKKDRKFLTCLLAGLSSVLIIHFFGSIYLTLVAMVKQDSFDFAWALISHQTAGKILYDIILGYLAVTIARPTKHILWLAMG